LPQALGQVLHFQRISGQAVNQQRSVFRFDVGLSHSEALMVVSEAVK
jgi:hypothetical protein